MKHEDGSYHLQGMSIMPGSDDYNKMYLARLQRA